MVAFKKTPSPHPLRLREGAPHYVGHRERLRERFIQGPESLPDYEILELLLCLAVPRVDVKPLAKALIHQFGSFAAVITSDPLKLMQVKGMGQTTVVALKLIQEGARRLLLEGMQNQPLLDSSQSVADYCRTIMAHLDVEQFRVFFLDQKNILIVDEVQQMGTVDHTPLYPREVMKRALDLGAVAVVIVHNHPSGDPTPSTADIKVTQQLKQAAEPLGVRVLDHVIVGKFGHTSFREKGLLCASPT